MESELRARVLSAAQHLARQWELYEHRWTIGMGDAYEALCSLLQPEAVTEDEPDMLRKVSEWTPGDRVRHWMNPGTTEPVMNFSEAAEALRELYSTLVEGSGDPVYRGPELSSFRLLAAGGTIHQSITPEWIEADEDQGRDTLDLFIGCVFRLGIEQGLRMWAEKLEEYTGWSNLLTSPPANAEPVAWNSVGPYDERCPTCDKHRCSPPGGELADRPLLKVYQETVRFLRDLPDVPETEGSEALCEALDAFEAAYSDLADSVWLIKPRVKPPTSPQAGRDARAMEKLRELGFNWAYCEKDSGAALIGENPSGTPPKTADPTDAILGDENE